MKDEELDHIFQEASQGIDFGDGASTWNDMKSKLKAEGIAVPESNQKKGFKWTSLLLILLLISSVGLLWNYIYNNENDQNQNAIENQNLVSESDQEVAAQADESNTLNSPQVNEDGNQPGVTVSAIDETNDLQESRLDEENIINAGGNSELSNSQNQDEVTSSTVDVRSERINSNSNSQSLKKNLNAGIVPIGQNLSSGDGISDNSQELDVSKSVDERGESQQLREQNVVVDKPDQQQVISNVSQTNAYDLENVDDQKREETDKTKAAINIFSENTSAGASSVKSSVDELTILNQNEIDQSNNEEKKLLTQGTTLTSDSVRTSNVLEADKSNEQVTTSTELTDKSSVDDKSDELGSFFATTDQPVSGQSVKEKEELINNTNDGDVNDNGTRTSSDNKNVSIFVASPALLDGKEFTPLEVKSSLFTPTLQADKLAVVQSIVDTQSEIRARRSRWSVGIEFSPDLSGASLGRVDDSGFNFGLNLEYHLTSKFSLSSGFVYAKKIYYADQNIESYNRNPNWVLDRVDATCDVIDIPINLNYYIAGRERSGFLLSAGLSTYFMLTEDYDILYEQPSTERRWSIRNENNHFLGIFNASIGYKKILSPTLSLQAEPFVKIPLQGIGEGEIDLFTSGLRLIFKYNQINIIK